jgi:hypothetical protein
VEIPEVTSTSTDAEIQAAKDAVAADKKLVRTAPPLSPCTSGIHIMQGLALQCSGRCRRRSKQSDLSAALSAYAVLSGDLRVALVPQEATLCQQTVGVPSGPNSALRLRRHKPQVSVSQLKMILPLAIVHTLGNLLTNVSLGKVAVSFTHTIKAMEPFFSVLLSAVFLGDAPTMAVVLSLMPIVGGVALASISEVLHHACPCAPRDRQRWAVS